MIVASSNVMWVTCQNCCWGILLVSFLGKSCRYRTWYRNRSRFEPFNVQLSVDGGSGWEFCDLSYHFFFCFGYWNVFGPIGHVRYINILTWLRGFQVKLLYLVLFLLFLSLLWELRDKRNLKNLQFWPESLGAMLEYWYIERGLFSAVVETKVMIFANMGFAVQ